MGEKKKKQDFRRKYEGGEKNVPITCNNFPLKYPLTFLLPRLRSMPAFPLMR